jgi:hypothetical protein
MTEEEVEIRNKDIEARIMEIEFINWICPNCKHKNRTIEFQMDTLYKKLPCMGCHKDMEYKFIEE